ncbi:hypothetical protein PPACK8108_LOCUS6243 [Phakopsora pachyrhizi]|uniref:Uncharacterized protein n=1 Tax=Phakopsora pachyrhizi TaxID=170000 RepID=A0AAV0AS69_PHAPC|nr:hypothetical protein PPACK8108_LOCUS6243 [Phakopsora pachyrhizi]
MNEEEKARERWVSVKRINVFQISKQKPVSGDINSVAWCKITPRLEGGLKNNGKKNDEERQEEEKLLMGFGEAVAAVEISQNLEETHRGWQGVQLRSIYKPKQSAKDATNGKMNRPLKVLSWSYAKQLRAIEGTDKIGKLAKGLEGLRQCETNWEGHGHYQEDGVDKVIGQYFGVVELVDGVLSYKRSSQRFRSTHKGMRMASGWRIEIGTVRGLVHNCKTPLWADLFFGLMEVMAQDTLEDGWLAGLGACGTRDNRTEEQRIQDKQDRGAENSVGSIGVKKSPIKARSFIS